MKINFLSGNTQIAKTYTPTEKRPYPHVLELTSHAYEITSLEQFYEHFTTHAQQGDVLLKGELTRPLYNESRASSTSPLLETTYIVLDIDRIPAHIKTPAQCILECLPPTFNNISYIWQHSNSALITKHCLAGHFIFLLKTPIDPKLLKQYITLWNFKNPNFEAEIRLSNNGFTLSYGLDPTCAQNDKLIFIANPILKDIPDPFNGAQRYTLTKFANDFVTLNPEDLSTLQPLINAKLQTLRAQKGLPNTKAKFAYNGATEYLKNPTKAIFRGPYIEARGFRYGNLNNGDSYGYYHHLTDPIYLYNFKGEPVVRIKDIDPDYWKQLQKDLHPTLPGTTYSAFRDVLTDTYYTVIEANGEIEALQVSSDTKAKEFLQTYNRPIPEILPLKRIIFDPSIAYIPNKDHVNLFRLSKYLRNAKPTTTCPPKFNELTLHIVNGDKKTQHDLINWLAFIVQFREKTQTAWILHGTFGTGKGTLFHTILRPILGENYCAIILLDQLDESFNAWLQNSLLVFVDEPQTDQAAHKNATRTAKIKTLITEPTCVLRMMRSNPVQITNYANFIFASNMHTPVQVDAQDRRFKVAPRQDTPIRYTETDIEFLKTQLQDIANYLMGIKVDRKLAKTSTLNAAKESLIEANMSELDSFVQMLKSGDLASLLAYRGELATQKNAIHKDRFETLLDSWIKHTGKELFIPMGDIRTIYNYLFNSDISPHRFGRLLASRTVKSQQIRTPNGIQRCIQITWNLTTEPSHVIL